MKSKNSYFFCPASLSLNKQNETGSLGLISYQFLYNLSLNDPEADISAVVFSSFGVKDYNNVKIYSLFNTHTFSPFDSLVFYIKSFLLFYQREEYRKADIIHHLMPFALNKSFNPFFIFKSPSKKYILGPIIGPHLKDGIFWDENRLNIENPNLLQRLKRSIVGRTLLRLINIVLIRLNKLTIRNADIVLFSDNYAFNSYKKYLSPKQKVKILNLGMDLKTFDRKNNYQTRKKDILRVLFVGRMHKRKGCEYVIKAISHVLKINPGTAISCTIVGFGPLLKYLKQLVRKLHLQKYIRFVGGVKNYETAKYYHESDVVCIPALSDTWMAVKEALCCGIPVITTNICSHPEIIKDGVNGFLVPVKDSEAIAYKLVQLANNRKILTRLSNNAYKESRIRYNWDTIINKYLSILNDKNI